MGTRSLTTVYKDYDYDDNVALVTIYRQYDGYPDGHGAELKEFLARIEIVNGFALPERAGTHANGMGCLAAQLVAHFKNDAGLGGIYLVEPGSKNHGEDYRYTVRDGGKGRAVVTCHDVYKEKDVPI